MPARKGLTLSRIGLQFSRKKGEPHQHTILGQDGQLVDVRVGHPLEMHAQKNEDAHECTGERGCIALLSVLPPQAQEDIAMQDEVGSKP